MMNQRGLRFWLVALALGSALAGCELVADFDRDKIPEPPRDAATFGDADIVVPDAAAPDEDSGTAPTTPPDEDAGR